MRTAQEWREVLQGQHPEIIAEELELVLADMEELEQRVGVGAVQESSHAPEPLTLYAEWVSATSELEEEILRLAADQPRLAALVHVAWAKLDQCIDCIPLEYDCGQKHG